MSLNLVQGNKKANDIHGWKWNGLGGIFEAGEAPEECVIRELREEAGLSIQKPKYCGLLVFTNFGSPGTSGIDTRIWGCEHASHAHTPKSGPLSRQSLGTPNFKGNDCYIFVFTASEFTGELIDSPGGRLEWIPAEKLLDLDLWESDHIFFSWIEERRFFSAKFEYEGDVMQAYNVVFHS